MCPPSYHYDGFVASHALGHTMHGCVIPKCMCCHKTFVVITGRSDCFAECVYIYTYIYIYIYICMYMYVYKQSLGIHFINLFSKKNKKKN